MKVAGLLTLALAAAWAPPASAQGYGVTLDLPAEVMVLGDGYRVTLNYRFDADTDLEAWRLGAAAVTVDGQPLGDRSGDVTVPFVAGTELSLVLDIAPWLTEPGSRLVALDGGEARQVTIVQGLQDPPDFMTLPAEELGKYRALFVTNRGTMLFEFWPDKAPGHVRNFLDLVQSGFYEGIQFHRVSPTFMIQGGCPNTKTDDVRTWGIGRGPRMLEAEFSDVPHERGILSMARGNDRNSASSQFFVMCRKNSALDGQYSVFGRLVEGDDTLKAISEAPGEMNPRDRTVRPSEPQRILRTIVLEQNR